MTLRPLRLAAYNFPKIGTEYMPPLDEGSILDMPVTVPRASVTEVADDIKARDALLRRFPEVEMVVGKAGRAETPTDPSPLEMVETVINLRPKEFWPKRKLKYADAERQTAVVLDKMVQAEARETAGRRGRPQGAGQRRHHDGRRPAGRRAARAGAGTIPGVRAWAVAAADARVRRGTGSRWRGAGRLQRDVSGEEIDRLADQLAAEFGPLLAAGPAQWDVNGLIQAIAQRLAAAKAVELNPQLLSLPAGPLREAWLQVGERAGRRAAHAVHRNARVHPGPPPGTVERAGQPAGLRDSRPGRGRVQLVLPRRPARSAKEQDLWTGPAKTAAADAALRKLRAELDGPFGRRLFLWQKTKADMVQEMDTVVQMPGWGNIWTQPIINRIDMLATGVRTMIGVKVFGDDLDKIQKVSEEVAAVLQQVPGAVDVFPDQNWARATWRSPIDRQKAARYGVNVGDIQDVIEVALGGKADHHRPSKAASVFPSASATPALARRRRAGEEPAGQRTAGGPVQIPLSMVADVQHRRRPQP